MNPVRRTQMERFVYRFMDGAHVRAMRFDLGYVGAGFWPRPRPFPYCLLDLMLMGQRQRQRSVFACAFCVFCLTWLAIAAHV